MATGKKYMKTFNNTLLHKLEDVVNEYVESIDGDVNGIEFRIDSRTGEYIAVVFSGL